MVTDDDVEGTIAAAIGGAVDGRDSDGDGVSCFGFGVMHNSHICGAVVQPHVT